MCYTDWHTWDEVDRKRGYITFHATFRVNGREYIISRRLSLLQAEKAATTCADNIWQEIRAERDKLVLMLENQ